MKHAIIGLVALFCAHSVAAQAPQPGTVARIAGFTITLQVGLKIEPTVEAPKAQKPAPVKRKKKKVVRRATKPAPLSLAGTWDWVAVCPVFGKVTGVTVYQRTGPGKYKGAISSSVSKRQAKMTATLNGRDFVQREQLGLLRVTGQHQLSANGRSATGTVNNGCTVTSKKR